MFEHAAQLGVDVVQHVPARQTPLLQPPDEVPELVHEAPSLAGGTYEVDPNERKVCEAPTDGQGLKGTWTIWEENAE